MMLKKIYPVSGLAVSMGLVLTGCGGSGSSPATGTPAQAQPVRIEFAAYAGNTPIGCNQPLNVGTQSSPAQLQDLRFYISELRLIRADDVEVPVTLDQTAWQYQSNGQGVALVDLENNTGACATGSNSADLNAVVTGTVPAGTYTGVAYTVGVPESLNHSDTATAPAPLNNSAMAWSWQSGRKFLKIEFKPDQPVQRPATATAAATTGNSYYVHLGSTGCTGNPATGATASCSNPNRMAFHSHSFDAASQKIAVDVQGLLANNDLQTDLGGTWGCMSGKTDPECAGIFMALKIDPATGLPLDSGHGQTLFRVVTR